MKYSLSYFKLIVCGLAVSFCLSVGYAQQYKSIDGSTLIRKEKERSRIKTVTVLNKDSSVLDEGYYVTDWPDQSRFYFYVNSNGQLERTAKKIFSNEKSFLMITMDLRNNKLNGKRTVYDNKIMISEANFKDGYIQAEKVFKNKSLIRENFYSDEGRLDSTHEYEQGTLEYTYRELDNGMNLRMNYFPDGKVQQWKEVDPMRKVMLTKQYDPTGRLLTEELVHGKDSVVQKKFYPNGYVSTENVLRHQKGTIREYDEQGKLISERLMSAADVIAAAPVEVKMASESKGMVDEK